MYKRQLSQAWLRPAVRQVLDLRLPLALLILLGVLADALLTRTGLDTRLAPVLAWARSLRRRHADTADTAARPVSRWPWRFRRAAKPLDTTAAEASPATDEPPPPPAVDDEARRRNRFDRAKRGQ